MSFCIHNLEVHISQTKIMTDLIKNIKITKTT